MINQVQGPSRETFSSVNFVLNAFPTFTMSSLMLQGACNIAGLNQSTYGTTWNQYFFNLQFGLPSNVILHKGFTLRSDDKYLTDIFKRAVDNFMKPVFQSSKQYEKEGDTLIDRASKFFLACLTARIRVILSEEEKEKLLEEKEGNCSYIVKDKEFISKNRIGWVGFYTNFNLQKATEHIKNLDNIQRVALGVAQLTLGFFLTTTTWLAIFT